VAHKRGHHVPADADPTRVVILGQLAAKIITINIVEKGPNFRISQRKLDPF